MKKILSITSLFILSAFLVFVTVGCDKEKKLFKEKSLENYTITKLINSEKEYVIERDGFNIAYTKDETTNYYSDYGAGSYLYTKKTKAASTEGEDAIIYVESTSSTVDFTERFDTLKNLTKNDLEKESSQVYSFKELTKNAYLIPWLDGDIYFDNNTKLIDAYKTGLISLDEARLTIKSGKPLSLVLSATYANKTNKVEINFSEFNTTKVEMLEETNIAKDYTSYLPDSFKTTVVTLKFKGYGEIKVELFDKAKIDKNVINYFLYLIKKHEYDNAVVDSLTSSSALFGNTTREDGLKKTIDAPSSPVVSNTRGTLAMVITNSDSKNTQQLVLNFGSNTSTNYYTIGGVVEGFSVMDRLAQLTSEEYAKLKVSVSVKYNDYKYAKPVFAD